MATQGHFRQTDETRTRRANLWSQRPWCPCCTLPFTHWRERSLGAKSLQRLERSLGAAKRNMLHTTLHSGCAAESDLNEKLLASQASRELAAVKASGAHKGQQAMDFPKAPQGGYFRTFRLHDALCRYSVDRDGYADPEAQPFMCTYCVTRHFDHRGRPA